MFYYSLCYYMAFIHDVMLEVFAVTCVRCTVVELIIDRIVVPCFVSVVSRTSRSTPLPRVVSNDFTCYIAEYYPNDGIAV